MYTLTSPKIKHRVRALPQILYDQNGVITMYKYIRKKGSGGSPIIHIRVHPRTLKALEAKAQEFDTTVSGVARDILDHILDIINYADTLSNTADPEQVRRINDRIERHAASRSA